MKLYRITGEYRFICEYLEIFMKNDIFSVVGYYRKHAIEVVNYRTKKSYCLHRQITLPRISEELSFINIWDLKRQNKWKI